MRIRKRELARPGVFGPENNPVVVTGRNLRDIAETFNEAGAPPVILGHDESPANPRLGYVAAVSFDEASGVLSGDVVETDALSQAVDEGYFPDCSIGAYPRAVDGRLYLRHLAYLGEQPPAIKDLRKGVAAPFAAPIAAADPSALLIIPPYKDTLTLSDPNNKEKPMTPEEVKAALEEMRKKISSLEGREAGGAPPPGADEARKRVDELTAENAELKEQLAKLAERYPDAGIELSDKIDPRLEAALKEARNARRQSLLASARGKLPKAKEPLLLCLSDSLSLYGGLELAEGAAKRSVSQFDLLQEIFAGMPEAVRPGALELGDKDGRPVDIRGLMGCV
jgi:hypothetical protein